MARRIRGASRERLCRQIHGIPVIDFFRVEPAEIDVGEQANLAWSAVNADRVEIQGVGEVPHEGELVVRPLQSTKYKLTAYGSLPTDASVYVKVHKFRLAELPELEGTSLFLVDPVEESWFSQLLERRRRG